MGGKKDNYASCAPASDAPRAFCALPAFFANYFIFTLLPPLFLSLLCTFMCMQSAGFFFLLALFLSLLWRCAFVWNNPECRRALGWSCSLLIRAKFVIIFYNDPSFVEGKFVATLELQGLALNQQSQKWRFCISNMNIASIIY